jgi:hypothetical protein
MKSYTIWHSLDVRVRFSLLKILIVTLNNYRILLISYKKSMIITRSANPVSLLYRDKHRQERFSNIIVTN